jgi:sec-independent protein translocase protein TatB
MFDVGFSEMVVVAVVALVVIGPERLPKVARMLGHLAGRMQRYVNDVKADINREMELEELRKLKDEFQRTAQNVEQSIQGGVQEAESEMRAISSTVESTLDKPVEASLTSTGPSKGNGSIAGDGIR